MNSPSNNTVKIILVFFLISIPKLTMGQNKNSSSTIKKTIITGIVTDDNNSPLPFVNVYIKNSFDGAMTDTLGKFIFTTTLHGKVELLASSIGYKKTSKEINVDDVNNKLLKIILKNEAVQTQDIIVTASSYSSEKGKGIVMTPMEVYMTPGGAADIFQTLKTLPGLTQVSESAELYIRGGSPDETLIMVDQAPVQHPYTYESAYGGIFSNINTSAINNMFFSSGGFSAKYGNTMSGVLDLETKNEPDINQLSAGISLANIDVTGSQQLINNKLGVRYNFRKNFTEPIFMLNGTSREFTIVPQSYDYYGSLIYRLSQTGQLKFFTSGENDKQGINVLLPGYIDQFKGNSGNNFYNLQYKDLLNSDIVIKSSLSFSRFTNKWELGVLDFTQTDKAFESRTDIDYSLSPGHTISVGFELENRKTNYSGIIPQNNYNYEIGAPQTIINAEPYVNRFGGYIEYEAINLLGIQKLYFRSGGRIDVIEPLHLSWVDPRFGIGYKFSDISTVSFSWGIFHEAPDPRYYTPEDGNPSLKSMHAIHYIISYEYKLNEDNNFRIEAYYKGYYNLPLDDDKINYSNSGYGYAKGIDFMYKASFANGFSGWISYGFIDTKRKWLDYQTLLPSDFDITNNLAVVLKYNISQNLEVGINYKYATGKPFSPVIGSLFQNDQHVYEPLYGVKNSSRLPDYQRLDLRLTYLTNLFGNNFTVFYVEALNVLNISNIFGYSYNYNYAQKSDVKSYFGRRMIVFGTQITF